MNTLLALQAATLAARKRTGDRFISTNTEGGKLQVVRVVPNGKKAVITPLSQPMSAAEAVEFLNNL